MKVDCPYITEKGHCKDACPANNLSKKCCHFCSEPCKMRCDDFDVEEE